MMHVQLYHAEIRKTRLYKNFKLKRQPLPLRGGDVDLTGFGESRMAAKGGNIRSKRDWQGGR